MAKRCFKTEVGGALVCVVRFMGRRREFYKKLQVGGRMARRMEKYDAMVLVDAGLAW